MSGFKPRYYYEPILYHFHIAANGRKAFDFIGYKFAKCPISLNIV
jgi:hypothetical protein